MNHAFITKHQTVAGKSAHGGACISTRWQVADNLFWVIDTQKRSSGMITTTAKLVTLEGDFETWTYGDPLVELARSPGRATEKLCMAQHKSGLDFLEDKITMMDDYGIRGLQIRRLPIGGETGEGVIIGKKAFDHHIAKLEDAPKWESLEVYSFNGEYKTRHQS